MSNDVIAHIIPKVLYRKPLERIRTGNTMRVFVCIKDLFFISFDGKFCDKDDHKPNRLPVILS